MKHPSFTPAEKDSLPELAGCYQYLDKEGVVIYVGKAKNLKRRVSSYFTKEHEDLKTRVLVSKICEIRFLVVANEREALLLENALIKELQPRYNVLLKDGKSYPSIVVTHEPFPRVFVVRKRMGVHGTFFGPFPDAAQAKAMVDFVRRLFPLRTCKHTLTQEVIEAKRVKLCLQYHIHRCKGPCRALESALTYQGYIDQVRSILKGDISPVKEYIKAEMMAHSLAMRFEEAQTKKRELAMIEGFESRSLVANTTYRNMDIFGYAEQGERCYVSYLHIDYGAVVMGDSVEYTRRIEEPREAILALAIAEMRQRHASTARFVVVPFLPDSDWGDEAEFVLPQRGDKAKLLALAERNAKEVMKQQMVQREKLNPQQREMRIMKEIEHDLRLDVLPRHIECFDNSNLQGTNPVAACVVFKDSKPSKRDYRHFHIKTVEGPNDFASMREVLTRRYTRLLAEAKPLPQVVIVDGGKGQLSAAVETFVELGLIAHIQLIGIAKRLEEIYFPGDPYPLCLDKNSETIKVIQRLRDEAHRFGITFHRQLRSKGQIRSTLDEIKGIGEKSKQALLTRFKSINGIRAAADEAVIALIGEHKTQLLRAHFANENIPSPTALSNEQTDNKEQ